MPGESSSYKAASSHGSEGKSLDAKELERSFQWMSICFSANHAVATTALVLASSVLDQNIGDFGNGLFFVATIVSTLVSPYVVSLLTAKDALRVSLSLVGVYMGLFTLSIMSSHRGYSLSSAAYWCLASMVGGVGIGIMWTSQGSYFAATASLLSEARGEKRSSVTASLAASFATIYLVAEVVWKVSSSIVLALGIAPSAISALCTAVCVFSVLGVSDIAALETEREMAGASSLDASCSSKESTAMPMAKLWLVVSLWSDPVIWLLCPAALCFGCSAALLNGFVNADYTTPRLGVQAPLYLSALTVVVAAGGTVALERLEKVGCGKGIIMAVGAVSFAALSLTLLDLPAATWWGELCLVMLYVFQGIGRAVYESTLRSVFADFFAGHNTEAAFANLMLQASAASALCFFREAATTQPVGLQWLVLGLAAAMTVSYPLAAGCRRRGYGGAGSCEAGDAGRRADLEHSAAAETQPLLGSAGSGASSRGAGDDYEAVSY